MTLANALRHELFVFREYKFFGPSKYPSRTKHLEQSQEIE